MCVRTPVVCIVHTIIIPFFFARAPLNGDMEIIVAKKRIYLYVYIVGHEYLKPSEHIRRYDKVTCLSCHSDNIYTQLFVVKHGDEVDVEV